MTIDISKTAVERIADDLRLRGFGFQSSTQTADLLSSLSERVGELEGALRIGEAWTKEYLSECRAQEIWAEVERVESGLSIIRSALTPQTEVKDDQA